MKIRLCNPYIEEIYEVVETVEDWSEKMEKLQLGEISTIPLSAIGGDSTSSMAKWFEKFPKTIWINPRHWALVQVGE